MENCARCGEVIRDSATPFLWKEEVVCGGCHLRLEEREEMRAQLMKDLSAAVVEVKVQRMRSALVPNYTAMRVVAGILEVLAWICVVIGGLMALMGGIGFVGGMVSREPGLAVLGGGMAFVGVVYGIAMGLYGVMLLGGAQLIYCLRDMGRNSFRIANALSLP